MTTKWIDFSKYTSIKIGHSLEVTLLDRSDMESIDPQTLNAYQIIGKGNNLLVAPNPKPLAMLSDEFNYIDIVDDKLVIGGATSNGKIFSFCKKNNIRHFEFTRNLPASLGGMVKMNAGMKNDEIFNHLSSIKTIEAGISKKIPKSEIAYAYRHTNIEGIILEASFDITYGFDADKMQEWSKTRHLQPHQPSAGSCFKNPEGDYAGRLIEAVGLKGQKVGDMMFSPTHANFLVNSDKGTFDDALYLIELAQKRVKEEFGKVLQTEVVIVR